MKQASFPIIVTTFSVKGSQAGAPYVKAVAGQGIPLDMRIDCCTDMRNSGPLGSHFEVRVQRVERKTGPALYAARGTPFEIISAAEAFRRIAQRNPVAI